METVEYFVVGVAADLVLLVYESVVDILALYEVGYKASVLGKNRQDTVKLRFFFAVDIHFEAVFYLFAYIFGKKFEVLVEYRLGSYIEFNRINILV